jgi:hypothetical protein
MPKLIVSALEIASLQRPVSARLRILGHDHGLLMETRRKTSVEAPIETTFANSDLRR